MTPETDQKSYLDASAALAGACSVLHSDTLGYTASPQMKPSRGVPIWKRLFKPTRDHTSLGHGETETLWATDCVRLGA